MSLTGRAKEAYLSWTPRDDLIASSPQKQRGTRAYAEQLVRSWGEVDLQWIIQDPDSGEWYFMADGILFLTDWSINFANGEDKRGFWYARVELLPRLDPFHGVYIRKLAGLGRELLVREAGLGLRRTSLEARYRFPEPIVRHTVDFSLGARAAEAYWTDTEPGPSDAPEPDPKADMRIYIWWLIRDWKVSAPGYGPDIKWETWDRNADTQQFSLHGIRLTVRRTFVNGRTILCLFVTDHLGTHEFSTLTELGRLMSFADDPAHTPRS